MTNPFKKPKIDYVNSEQKNKLSYKLGQFWNNLTGQTAARESEQQYNAEQAALNRQWQEEMSNTAVQRQVADMEQAGINPAAAFSSGSASGASTPGGATASAGSGSSSGAFSAVIGAIGTMAVGLGKAKMFSAANKAASAATKIAKQVTYYK